MTRPVSNPTDEQVAAAEATCLAKLVAHARFYGIGHPRAWQPTRYLADECGFSVSAADRVLNRLHLDGTVTWWAPGCCQQGVVWSATAKALEDAPKEEAAP